MRSLAGIVSRRRRGPPAPLGALRAAGLRRLHNGLLALPVVVRAEILAFAAACVALLSIHADYNYFAPSGEAGVTWVTLASRVVFGLLLLAGAALAQYAPRLVQRAGDADFLTAAPVPPEAQALWRADGVAVAALPLGLVATGLLLPPLEFGAWDVVAAATATWLAWLWALSQGAAWTALVAPEAAWEPAGLGGLAGRAAHYLIVPLTGAAYAAAREAIALVLDPREPLSLWATALAGLAAGLAVRAGLRAGARTIAHRQARLAEHRWIVERRRRARRAARRGPWRGALAGSPRVWWEKDWRVVLRTPSLRWQWAGALVIKAVALGVALLGAEKLPWAFAGILLLLSDFVLGVAVLQTWAREEMGWTWAAPSPRRAQWWARVAPPLAASLAASLALAVWAAVYAGPGVARPLALWTVVSGVSLVVAAGNLGISSPPQSAQGQNLYALGLLCALLVSAVYPVVGWAVLGLFALYTVRSVAQDPRS